MDNGASSYLRFLNGDNDSFVELVKEYGDGLILFLNSIIRDIHIAEEAANDTLMKLYIKKPQFKSEYSFKTWLYTIGRNVALNYLKKLKRHKYTPLEDFSYFSDNIDLESEYIQDEENLLIHQCIKALNKDYAQVLFLIYFENLSHTEAAKVMNKSQRQITQLLYCAKEALKVEMGRRGNNGQI